MITSMDGDRLVGYARVSTGGQDLSLQLDALQKQGVAKDLIFTDKASGAKHERPGLDACFRELKRGDVIARVASRSPRTLGAASGHSG